MLRETDLSIAKFPLDRDATSTRDLTINRLNESDLGDTKLILRYFIGNDIRTVVLS